MTDEALKPKRKRWPWITSGILLFAVSAAGWWYWPRIDPSLVGKWRISSNNKERFPGSFELRPDGTGQILVRNKKADQDREYFVLTVHSFDWRVVGNSFAVLVENKSGFPLWDRAMRHAYSYTKHPVFRGSERFTLDRSNGDRLQLDGPPHGSPFLPASFSMTRVRE